jgi:hypothetical protein
MFQKSTTRRVSQRVGVDHEEHGYRRYTGVNRPPPDPSWKCYKYMELVY